ncbi:Glycoside hydrolase family 5 protein [Entamoeba marina]
MCVFVLLSLCLLSHAFIKVKDQNLINEDGSIYVPRGIAFTNCVWFYSETGTEIETDHSLEDYSELKEIGFNSVRLYLTYAFFESDDNPYNYSEVGFEWLNNEIAAAKENDIGLILNMHFTQGGDKETSELWTNEDCKERLIALWKEIARRYVNEETIIGFGLINEPVVTNETLPPLDQLETMMNLIAEAIREEDTNHVLFVERMIGYFKDGSVTYGNINNYTNFRIINDSNTCYEFHYYKPMCFTHQGFSSYVDIYSSYPSDLVNVVGSSSWVSSSRSSTSYNISEIDTWQFIEGKIYTVDESSGINYYTISLYGNGGTIFMDDIVITEYDENDTIVSQWSEDFSEQPQLSMWSSDGVGSCDYVNDFGHNNNGCIMVEYDGEYFSILNTHISKITTNGHKYKVDGWIYMNATVDAIAYPRFEYRKADEVYLTDFEYLNVEMLDFLQLKLDYNVPEYMGEFGVTKYSFENERGGDQWVSDVMDLSVEYGIGFDYHYYHGTFGLYTTPINEEKGELNEVLLNVFTTKLKEMNEESSEESNEENKTYLIDIGNKFIFVILITLILIY